MKNKQARRLMVKTCIRVSDNEEVSWMTSFSRKAAGSTLIYSDYLGQRGECISEIRTKYQSIGVHESEIEIHLYG